LVLNALTKTGLPGRLSQGSAIQNREEENDNEYHEVSSLHGISQALAEVGTLGRALSTSLVLREKSWRS